MRHFTISDLYRRNSLTCGQATAIVCGDERISYRELDGHADRLANTLIAKAISRGERVGVLAMNHPGFFVLLGGVARAGAILVPLNWRLAAEELLYIIKDSDIKVLFTDGQQLARAREIAVPLSVPVVQLGTAGWPAAMNDTGAKPLPVIGGDTPLCLIYTAAVDGRPKGAVLSHANLISANLQVIGAMGLGAAEVYLNMLPLFHITGLNLALAVMHVGGKNVVTDKFDEQQTLVLTARENVSLWGSFPPILQRMVKALEQSGAEVPSLRHVVGIDNPQNIASFAARSAATFWILYGQSETSGFVTLAPAAERPGTAGRAGLLSTFRIVDDQEREVAAGESGEIVVRGPLVFQGYWRLDDETNRVLRDGWHHTGDIGAVDEAGYLVFLGRKPEKELIKPGGENVYPAEVEAVILDHRGVAEVCVIGVEDSEFGEGVKAVCVLHRGATLSAGELIDFVGSRIARYKKPRYVQFVDRLPKSGGEIDRAEVKRLYGGQR